ncbi:RagB/SusD family nutrient uptake outer membrane protein [Pseudoflavitalea sp. G-6-1-2]|uniref:RagB/SusD family nutrient uptake outer membrane protein n=1 Tax=Pseudoflavitalea sp. G-6-1-2 TaxID=2728841 RepID=UPI00146F0BB6|nr:RagB/SusD family nutrient uptake outer membrane protein [Pseudoflavitalea sp. G-6-1-2]NML23838.1 RagB/SusD family nutrient uptake outer membrane protein [Pseudoflavitalea sp. G-6-1-2]
MKSNIFLALGIFFGSATVVSCSKVLDKAPLDSYTDESVWKDLKLAEAYGNNIYNVLPTMTWDWGNSINRSFMLSAACDESFNKFDYGECRSVFNAGLLSPDNAGDFDIWARCYHHIQNANVFLSRIDNVPGDDAFRKRIKGEVTFLRAYAYFMLVNDYGGVPLIKEPFKLSSDFKVARSSYEDCVKFITAELDAAASMLPPTNAPKGRITGALAMAIKSRMLLYAASDWWNDGKTPTERTPKWQAASDAAKAVIDLNAFSLFTGKFETIFTSFNNELIGVRLSSKQYLNAFDGVEEMCMPNGYRGWSAYAPTQDLVDAFGTADGKYITDATSGYNPQNPYVNRDPRFYASIIFDGRPTGNPAYYPDRTTNQAQFYEGGYDSDQGYDTWNNSLTRYTFRKYMDTTYNYRVDKQTNKFWILSRLGEIYLNYAEAQFHLGHEDVAREYLNKIRSRAGITNPITESGDALRDRIRNERQVELCFEGHRYYDVRRWKIANVTENRPCRQVIIQKNLTTGVRTFTYQTLEDRAFDASKHYLMPIPRTEINRTGLKQNDNYQ